MTCTPEATTAVDKAFAQANSVTLKPFGHQVGGHSLLMKFDNTTICKPVILRELLFYKSVREELKKYTPTYHGVIKVRYEKQADGQIVVLAERVGVADAVSKQTNGIQPHNTVDMKALLKCTPGSDTYHHNGSVDNGEYSNPWSKSCLQTLTQQLSDCTYLESITQDYIVLDNLTTNMSCPCVLDLKMGTRQYGDDASDMKKAVFEERCALSTSQSMGVRISGIQIYNNTKKQFSYRDKYYGRSLDQDGFLSALKEFVHDGTSYRTDVIPIIIANLKELREMVSRQHSYRFYSSSLLILYDGDKTTHGVDVAPNVLVRMIDFAHTTCSRDGYQSDPIQYSGPDEGYVLGLTSLISAFQSHLDQVNR